MYCGVRGARVVDFGSVADASVVEKVHRDPFLVIRNEHVSIDKVACYRLERSLMGCRGFRDRERTLLPIRVRE